jgi:G3E family GTPase
MSWIGQLVQQADGGILRTKGVLNAQGFDEKVLFQSVRMLTSMSRLSRWEGSESRNTEFVLIGRHLDREALEAGFKECVAR